MWSIARSKWAFRYLVIQTAVVMCSFFGVLYAAFVKSKYIDWILGIHFAICGLLIIPILFINHFHKED